MATKNADGSVVLRTRGALAYNPSGSPATGISRPSTAKSLGGGGYESSGRLTAPKGQTTSSKSALG